MFPTRWLLALPFAVAVLLGSCARHPSTGVRSVASDQLSRGDGKRLFDAFHVHCWQVDLPAVTGAQYVVVKLELRYDGKPGVIQTPRIFGNERHAIVAVAEDGPNQAWSIITSTGNSSVRPSEPQPLASVPNISATYLSYGDRQKDRAVRLARWECRDGGGKLVKTVDAVVMVEKRIGEGLGQLVP